jgi:hypothetical protein
MPRPYIFPEADYSEAELRGILSDLKKIKKA